MNDMCSCRFSVIVPVYNVREYLDECVNSVLKQSFRDYEIILVDDGSRDGSGELCDKLALTDSRIRVHHQENKGLSGARNSGLPLAAGEYVLFLDSDDFYPQEDFLENLAKAAAGADVVCFNYARYTDRLLNPMISFPEQWADTDGLWLALTKANAYQSSAWSKAVKRQLLLDNAIAFERGTLSEDIEWSARVMGCAKSVAIAPACLYAYRVRMGSISKTVSPKHVADQLRIIGRLAQWQPEGSETFLEAFHGYVGFQYSTLMINALLSRPKISSQERARVKELSWLLKYDANRIVKLIRTVKGVLGFALTSRLLLVYFKLFCK